MILTVLGVEFIECSGFGCLVAVLLVVAKTYSIAALCSDRKLIFNLLMPRHYKKPFKPIG